MKQIIELNTYKILEQKKSILDEYQKMVFQWEKKTDLIGMQDHEKFFQRHIINGLNLLHFLNEEDLIIHDIGTGAGIPGLICRICDDNQNRKYILFEKKYQKRSFLQHIILKFNLNNIEIRENYPDVSRETCDILTSRALLTLGDMVQYQPSFKKFVLFKGRNYMSEINALNNQEFIDKLKIYKSVKDDSYFIFGEKM